MKLPDDPLQGDPLEVLVRGERFTGWKSVDVLRPLDAAAGSFTLTFGPDLERGFPVLPGDAVQIVVAGEKLLDGYCDAIGADTQSSDDVAEGRDKTADLVDSTFEREQSLVSPAPFAELVTLMVRPFNLGRPLAEQIGLANESSRATTLIRQFASTPGENVWTAIERLARTVGVLVYTDGSGRIVMADAGGGGRASGLLQGEGGRVLHAALVEDHTERFDTYVVRGQRVGTDDDFGASIVLVEGAARDPAVGRRRPLIVIAENAVTSEEAERRAQWEAARRAARSKRLTVTVTGWRQDGNSGPLWRPNQLCPVKIPRLRVDAELLVNRARFIRSRDEGTLTILELVRADAFSLEPEVDREDPFLDLEDE